MLLISDKVFFKSESFARVKGDSFIMVKRSVSQDDIKIKNLYAPSFINSKYIM